MKGAKPGRIDQFLEDKEEDSVRVKAKDLEIAIVAFLSRHSVPPGEAECLMKIVKKYDPDSEIIKQVALGREKASYLTIFALGDTFEEETVRKMKSCDAWSVQIDESAVPSRHLADPSPSHHQAVSSHLQAALSHRQAAPSHRPGRK